MTITEVSSGTSEYRYAIRFDDYGRIIDTYMSEDMFEVVDR